MQSYDGHIKQAQLIFLHKKFDIKVNAFHYVPVGQKEKHFILT